MNFHNRLHGKNIFYAAFFLIVTISVVVLTFENQKLHTIQSVQAATAQALQENALRRMYHQDHFGEDAVKQLNQSYARVKAGQISTIPQRIDPLRQFTKFSKEVKVFALAYFPPDPAISDHLDPRETGHTENMTIKDWEAQTQLMINNGAVAVSNATRYKGYLQSWIDPYIKFSVYKYKKYYVPIPRGYLLKTNPDGTKVYRPHYHNILLENNICDMVDNYNVREVWMYGYHYGHIEPDESRMSSTFGDISNSGPKEQNLADIYKLPVCKYAYVLYNFTYNAVANYSNNIHNRMHQMENVMGFIDGRYGYPPTINKTKNNLFWGDFSEFQPYENKTAAKQYTSSCGNGHWTPNWTDAIVDEYRYNNTNKLRFNCESWLPIDAKTTYMSAGCERWDCTDLGYYMWWLQSMPGQTYAVDPKPINDPRFMRNWWDSFVEFNAFATQGRSPYFGEPCIQGVVFRDTNNDGIQVNLSSEPFIPNVWVLLFDDQGSLIDLNIRTDAQGKYRFCGLQARKYEIQVAVPTGYRISSVFIDPNKGLNYHRNVGRPISGNSSRVTSGLVDVINFNKPLVDFGFVPVVITPTPV